MTPESLRPSRRATLLLTVVVVVSSFVSNSLALPITEQQVSFSAESEPISQVEIIQDPLPSTEDLIKSSNDNNKKSSLISLNFPHIILSSPGDLLPSLLTEETNLPQLKSSSIETAESFQDSPQLELLRRIIPFLPSSVSVAEEAEGDARPLTSTEIQEVVVGPVVKAEAEVLSEVSDSHEAVEPKEAAVDKESFNLPETLEESNNNLPAKAEVTTNDNESSHSNDTKTIITNPVIALNKIVNSAVNTINDLTQVAAGHILDHPLPLLSAVNPFENEVRNGSSPEDAQEKETEVKTDEAPSVSSQQQEVATNDQESNHSNDTKIIFVSPVVANNLLAAAVNTINDAKVVVGNLVGVPLTLIPAVKPIQKSDDGSTAEDAKKETEAAANDTPSLSTSEDSAPLVPSEIEVDDVRTPESSLVNSPPEVNESQLKDSTQLASALLGEEAVPILENSPTSDIYSSAIPLIPDYLSMSIPRQRVYAEDGSTLSLDPMSLVIPILPSLPAEPEPAVANKDVRTEQLIGTDEQAGQQSNLRLTNPLPLLASASSQFFREPMTVLSQQAERFRPFMKYVSSHVPSFSVDPFNINNREAGDDNAEVAETEDDLSAFFYLQDRSDPLNHVIPLIRGKNILKANEEPAVPTNKASVDSEVASEVNSESSPVIIEVDSSKTPENSQQELVAPPPPPPQLTPVAAQDNSPAETSSQDKNPSLANDAVVSNNNEGNKPAVTNSQVSPSPSVIIAESPNAAIHSDSPAAAPPAVVTNNKPQSSSRPNSNTNAANNKPPRPPYGIQSSTPNKPSSAAAATPPANPPRPFSIPGILLNPIEALGWSIPSFQWPSFSQMLRRLFGRNDPNNINTRTRFAADGSSSSSIYEKLRFGLEFEDFCGDSSEEQAEVKSAAASLEVEGNTDKSMCGTESSACNKFCNQHGFNNGTCFNGENCVCDMVREEGTFGLTFKRLADYGEISRMESLDLDDESHPLSTLEREESEMKCQRCSCAADCKKSGAYIGLCGNTCYCGLPWQTGSLTL